MLTFIQSGGRGTAGVALLMVITAITILAYILGDVTFETQLNKTKAYQIIDKEQARLNAESGLALAMVQLTIYQQARNLLSQNKEQLKNLVTEKDIEEMLLQPMMFPLEVDKKMNILQRQAVEEFTKTNLLPGGLFLEITPENGFLNPNALAVTIPITEDSTGNKVLDPGGPEDETSAPYLARQEFLEALNETLKRAQDNEQEEHPERWQNLDTEKLVQELTVYVSLMGRNDYVSRGINELAPLYKDGDAEFKNSKMFSLSEMYALAGWSEDLVNLMIDQLSAHNAKAINLNHITEKQLKWLVSDLTVGDDQIKEFFHYRDGDPSNPESDTHSFKGEDDLYTYFRTEWGMGETDIEKIREKMKKLGLNFTVASDVFKILAKGSSNDATYELEAFVTLPEQANSNTTAQTGQKVKTTKTGKKDQNGQTDPNQTTKSVKLLGPPRVVEISVW